MQLAGAIPAVRPVAKLGEHILTWVQVIKYLGIMLLEGRRCRLPCPDGKLWQSYHRTKPALDHRLPVSLLSQLHVIKTYVLSIALYPAAVRDLDYAAIDIFVNRLLKKITGTPRTRSGATFLRAELGLPSSKFMAHYRALSYYWHLRNKAWFKGWLPHLRGRGPLARIEKMAELHGVDLAGVESNSREAWKTIVRKATLMTATAEVNKTLDARENSWPSRSSSLVDMWYKEGRELDIP
jgi:hypothetical protein